MSLRRKLQVFISSTFTDLKEERQAAVEAVLTAGHIPAGMELFASGDESQMTVIRRWIDESDVYLLLLGGRYGSLEPESGKSYTHLEYEYAVEKGKALFAVVITDAYLDKKIKAEGRKVIESHNQQKLDEFKKLVTSKLVKFWNDKRDIQLAVLQTLSDFDRRNDLVGWVPGSEVANTGFIAEELARLTKENAELRRQLSTNTTFNGVTFNDLYNLLNNYTYGEEKIKENYLVCAYKVANIIGEEKPSLISYIFMLLKTTDGYRLDTYHETFKIECMLLLKKSGLTEANTQYPGEYEFTSLFHLFKMKIENRCNASDLYKTIEDFLIEENITDEKLLNH